MSTNLERGIIFKLASSKDADRIITIINESGMKKSFIAKGVKKLSSKRGQSLEIGNFIECKFVDGYGLSIVTEVKLISELRFWKMGYHKMFYLQLFCEVIAAFSVENHEDDKLFQIFYEILNIQLEKNINLELATAAFILKVINISGNMPPIDECTVTHKKLGQGQIYYTPGEIGYSSKNHTYSFPADEIIYKTQKYLLGHNLSDVLKVQLDDVKSREMLKLHIEWLELILDKELKSKKLII